MSNEEFSSVSGILLLDKPAGITSHDAVNRVRRLYHTRQVGHTGTLDPMATGLLPILVGRAAKAAEFLGADRKEYQAVLRLGLTTDTEDVWGKPLTEYTGTLPPWEQVRDAICAVVGKSGQVPPMYSAIKINGQKLVDLARKEIEVERSPRPIEIFAVSPARLSERDYSIRVVCSKGTYIRSLCRDIGQKLGCGGCMAELRRLGSGSFRVEDSFPFEQLEQMDDAAKAAALLPIEQYFSDAPAVRLPPFFEKLARNGLPIDQKKIRTAYPCGMQVRLYGADNRFFALGGVIETDEGSALKPLKQFEI